ncbi:MAG: beta-ureidopropionase / N-carbamoyl-L-amino-acid hydrolase [Acidimicrobiaceae bacterium]|jgi:N-carbamoyl-L-amino-acid hydrolase
MAADLRISFARLRARLDALGELGATDGGGSCRLALTDEDKSGRDLVVTWMRDLGLRVTIDGIGNVVATWPPDRHDPPVLTGSHIDTVATGGRYDGCLGVLAGLEVLETAITAGIETEHPLAVAFFTDEEGSRFPPDMLGSLVFAGGMALEDARSAVGVDGAVLGDELDRIGYAGVEPCPARPPHAYVELHIEQGPVLEADGITIGAVTGVQGISWTEIVISGQSNHAGTTPMSMRRDAADAAFRVGTFVRTLADDFGPPQVGTVGRVTLHPNLVNVVAARATMTVDLRNTDDAVLQDAEARLFQFLTELAEANDLTIEHRSLARFDPVEFDDDVVALVERVARDHGHTVRRLPSGAGHDAQMLARVCPAGMVFVPSFRGISHNPAEHTDDGDLEAGANVLLHCLLELAGVKGAP